MVSIIKSSIRIPVVLILFLMMMISFKLTGQSSSNNKIQKDVISSAGSPLSSANFGLMDAMGQPAVIGVSNSTNYIVSSGFLSGITGHPSTYDEPFLPILYSEPQLDQNYPNPFRTMTTIRFSLPEAGWVKLEIYTILGRHVATLFDEYKTPGVYHVNFNRTILSPGLYMYKMQVKQFQAIKKMSIME